MLATPTTSSDTISTLVTGCSEVMGCAPLRDLFGERQARTVEQRLVAVLKKRRYSGRAKAPAVRAAGRRRDEDRGAAGVADNLVAAGELKQ